jgi:hypothetical protein
MNIEKAQKYFQSVYNNHAPIKETRSDGSWYYITCRGDHGVSGYEWEVDYNDEGYCYDYVHAAEVLELPLAPMELSPPRDLSNPSPFEKSIMNAYAGLVENMLKSMPKVDK